MRALTAEQRADREHDARVKKWSKAVKAAQQAITDHNNAQAKLLAKNDAERKRIEAECQYRNSVWADRLNELERELEIELGRHPIQSYVS